jgi:23S rRNA pseudouridine2605 synthase
MDERLNKRIAASGLTSRRGADNLIEAGKVAINGQIVTSLGATVTTSDTITVEGKPLPTPQKVTYALYKPRGVVSSTVRQGSSPAITELVPVNPPVYPIGRLDKESEGLILLTNDGELAYQLTHPKFEHQKTYVVECKPKRPVEPSSLATRLLAGVMLRDGKAKADEAFFQELKPGILQGTITIHEGRHHIIRRMCATVELQVTRLTRTRIGQLAVDGMKPGEWRVLTPTELRRIA